MKILFAILASCLAAGATKPSPVAEAKYELSLLAKQCSKISEAGGACPDLRAAATKAEQLCRATHKSYMEALAKAQAKVKETEHWMATKQMLNETEDQIIISFDLSDDPDYPMIDSEDIVNEALAVSLRNMEAVGREAKEIRKKRSCSEAKIKIFLTKWSDPARGSGMDRAHERIATAISNYILGALRAFESGAHEDAIKALERETGAKVRKVR